MLVEQGVVVTDVEDNSIAAAQDIQREDVITEVDGKPVRTCVIPRGPQQGRSEARRPSVLDAKAPRLSQCESRWLAFRLPTKGRFRRPGKSARNRGKAIP
jgi:hypothetical protein